MPTAPRRREMPKVSFEMTISGYYRSESNEPEPQTAEEWEKFLAEEAERVGDDQLAILDQVIYHGVDSLTLDRYED
jgi:hypothetical protein